MAARLAQEAGAALVWKAIQHGAVNVLYLTRLLILARILAPRDFGVIAIAMTAITLFSKVTDLGMEPALVQKHAPTDRHYDTAWTVGVIRAAAIGAVLFVSAPLIAGLFGEPSTVEIIRVLSALPLVEAAASIKVAGLVRSLRFRSLAVARLIEALTNMIVSIALAPALGVWALVVGTLAGPAVYGILSYVFAPYRPRVAFDRNATRALISYGRWIFVTSLMVVCAGALLRMVISRQLGAAELGIYFLAAKLAFWPSEVASEVMGGISFPVYARIQSNIVHTRRAFLAVLTSTMLVLAPVFALMIALAPFLVEHVLGAQWSGAEPLIRLLAVVGFVGLVGDAVVPLLKGLGQPHKYALLEGAQSLLLVACAGILVSQFGLLGAGYAWLAASLVTTIVSILLLRQILHFSIIEMAGSFGAITVAALAGAFVANHVQVAMPSGTGFALALASGIATTVAMLWTFNRIFELRLTSEFSRAFPRATPLLAKSE